MPTVTISPSGIPTSELFGDPTDSVQIFPVGISSDESFGSSTVGMRIAPTGFADTQFGSPTTSVDIFPVGIPSKEAFGSAKIGIGISPTAIGIGISPTAIGSRETFGRPRAVQRYTYTGSGTITIGGAGSYALYWDFDLVAQYKLLATLIITQTFQYNMGNLPMFWFQVQGVCKQNNTPNCANNTGPVDESGLQPIPSMGNRPISGNCPQNFIQTVPATTPADVCSKLAQNNWIWRLNRMSKFSVPVNPAVAAQMSALGLIDPNCNQMTDVPFCQLPECQEFCLDGDGLDSWGASASVTDVFYRYVGGGPIHLTGSAPASIIRFFPMAFASPPKFAYKSDGRLELKGTASVKSSYFKMTRPEVPPIDLLLGGEAGVKSSHFRYRGEGSLNLTGKADIASSHIRTRADGGLSLGGSAKVRVKKNYLPKGFKRLSGSAPVRVGPLRERADPEVFALTTYNIDPTGIPSAEAFGSTLVNPQIVPSAIVEGAFGTPALAVPNLFTSHWGGKGIFVSLEPMFNGIPAPALVTPTIVLGTICGCNDMPTTLQMSHNLNGALVFSNFLARNGLTMPTVLQLVWSNVTQSYQANNVFFGISNDGNTKERWHVLFTWACTSVFGGSDVGSNAWQFSMLITRRNTTTGNFNETRLMAGFPPQQICAQANISNGLDFTFKYNVITNQFVTAANLVVDISTFYDDLDLFTTAAWVKNPYFTVNISGNAAVAVTPRMDISTIFPNDSTVWVPQQLGTPTT